MENSLHREAYETTRPWIDLGPRIRVHCQHTEHAYFVDITEIHSAASAGSPGSGGGVAGCLPPTTAAQLCLPLPPTECQKFMQNTSDQKTFSFQRKFNFNFTQRISFIKIVFLRWLTHSLSLDSSHCHCIGFPVEVDGSMDLSIPTDLVEAKKKI